MPLAAERAGPLDVQPRLRDRLEYVCPGCSHRWQHTECLACHQVSPHRAWYHWPDDVEPRRRKREEHEPTGQL